MKCEFMRKLQACIAQRRWRISYHASKRCDERGFEVREVLKALAEGEIIETYPEDLRGASCLILGRGPNDEPLHIVCSMDSEGYLVIITVYRPEKPKWIDERTRGVKIDEDE